VSELYERFERLRRDQPARLLIHRATGGDAVTAAELASLTLVIRDVLGKAGTAPGQPVVAIAGNTATGIGLLLACRNLGIPLLPVDKSASPSEIGAIASRFGARLVVGSRASLEHAPGLEGSSMSPLPDGLTLAVRPSQPADRVEALVDVAVMKLTSGSTGMPRATMTTDGNAIADGMAIMESMSIRPSDVQLAAIPLSHAYGLGNLTLPLILQGTAIVVRDGFVPHQVPQDGARYGITMFPGVPFMFDHLLEHLPADGWPPSLVRLITAGARIEPLTVARFKDKFDRKIHSFYGTSETGGICFDDGPEVDAEPTVGTPMPNVTVTLRPEDGAPADGGRVHVSGPAVASGYAAGLDPQTDNEEPTFVDGGFLTGDLGRFDARHHLQLHGRVSSFVNVAGRKVQPQEVEALLREAPGVADVRVLGAPDALRGQQLVACVVVSSPEVTATVLRSYCAARLAPFKIPRQFVFLDRIPLTERGKADRARLEALVASHIAATR
jgi:acyl-CoA synthetase (AMP-forming)/AMP-acid ligase II